ncbi:hypothetical protein HOLDEFILI_03173 [Holdemania filiformis DSM 12042]|uniref:Uncharacterized protein n=1 Tax=Holdemania filiformis DSM 12042 TaxID=545696 RepID=B9YBG6_9FIRM|nr:hypothetical protein HOLDEFILI_03173 [Holdemania filiformis DSM 12042]
MNFFSRSRKVNVKIFKPSPNLHVSVNMKSHPRARIRIVKRKRCDDDE